MSWVELVPLEGGASINLPDGQTVVGRGPFLGVNDKRVSRNHAVLENADGRLRLKPTHSNPCFVQSSLEGAPRALERERWFCLRHGDIFSLLPGRLMYRVEAVGGACNHDDSTQRNSQELDPEENGGGPQAPVSPSEDHRQPVSPSEDHRQPVSPSEDQTPVSEVKCEKKTTPLHEDDEDEDDEDDEDHLSFNKTTSGHGDRRVLPAWMTSASSAPKAGGGARAPKRPRADGHNDNPAPKVRKTSDDPAPKVRKTSDEDECRAPSQEELGRHRLQSDEEEELDTPSTTTANQRQHGNKTDTPPTASANHSTVKEESSHSPAHRKPCPYGRSCYRKNPLHFQEFSHHGDQDYEEKHEDDDDDDDDEERPECPYGTDCYRKNPLHRKEFKHSKRPARSSTRATRRRRDNDDDEEEESWDDDDDSFINDEDSDDAWDDQDYAPPGSDDSDGENVKRLTREAKNFTKNFK